MFTRSFFTLPFFLAPALAAIIDIKVGDAGGLAYSPNAIGAAVGDQVVFHFLAKNHTVTQSSLADPCAQKSGGFDSGFMPIPANLTDNFPTYTVEVKDTNPIWVYCRQGAGTPNSHCGKGMVFAINCGTDGSPNSFTSFQNAALAEGAALNGNVTSSGGYGSSSSGSGYSAPGSSTPPPATPSSSNGATSTGSGSDAVHTVVVGGPGVLAFNPPEVQAKPGDTVVFEFHQKNHTVTQSSFAQPCQWLAQTPSGAPGFDTGYMPVADSATNFPTWNLTVNDTNPIWAYCRQGNHCQQGMVFAINSVDTSAKNYTAFKQAAQLSSSNSSSPAASPATTGAASSASHFAVPASFALAAVGAVFALW